MKMAISILKKIINNFMVMNKNFFYITKIYFFILYKDIEIK